MAASIINTNLMSLNAQRNLNKNSLGLATSLERLSSGLRVNSARDDAAGLAVGMTLQSDIRSLSVQMRNEADKISSAQNSDAGLGVATDILQRMNELAVQAQGTNGQAQVANINTEYTALVTELANITGSTASTVASLTASNGAAAATAAGVALTATAATRAGHGATMAVAEFTIQRFEASREAKSAERSRIMDTDFAMETANLARGQILMQAGTAMVAQANSIPQNVLALLR
ncbi:MAG: flagellin [Gammaproteobacteria bacterium]|nr:flagellin [Gammaproteobacteria bacterium]